MKQKSFLTKGTRVAYRDTEVAEMLGMSVRKVRDLIASGKLGSAKIDKCRRITPEHIAALLGSADAAHQAEADQQ
jgi:excisionase family DNA binding protein